MKSASSYSLVAFVFALCLGCEKKPEAAPTPAADPAPAAATPPVADNPIAAAVALDLSKVPVEEQFEKEVETEVTAQNFESQLEALEKEIKAE